jgi:glycosyltransferase involved in cell wall biosynthesis
MTGAANQLSISPSVVVGERPLTILLVNKFLFPFGGVESVVFAEKALLESHGHRVVLFGMHHPRNIETPWARYFVSRVDYADRSLAARLRAVARALYSIEAQRKVCQLIRDAKPDVAHVHHVYHQITPSILYALRAARVPVVQTIHDYKPVCPNAKCYLPASGEVCFRCRGGRFYHAIIHNCGSYGRASSALIALEAYLNRLTRVYERHVSLFLTPSHFLRDKLVEGGMPANRIRVVPNFVEPDAWRASDDGRHVLFAGRLEAYKGVLNVLEAARRLPNIPFRIVGSGTLEAEVRRIAASLPNVTVTGHLDHAALRAELMEACCLVAPSLWHDVAPQVVLEAFACGKPVIAVRRGGLQEMVEHGVNGLLLTSDDPNELAAAVAMLWEQPCLRARMGHAARETACSRYAPARHYQALMAAYAFALGSS